MVFDSSALEILYGIDLAVGQQLLHLVADRVAQHVEVAVLVPELEEPAADAVLGLGEIANVGLADEEDLFRESDGFGELCAQPASLGRVWRAGALGAFLQSRGLEPRD